MKAITIITIIGMISGIGQAFIPGPTWITIVGLVGATICSVFLIIE